SSHQLPRTSMVSRPRLSSLTVTGSPHSGQRMTPSPMRVAKIMSSNVSPSPRAYQGPSAVIRSSTSAAGVSGEAAKRQKQCGQYSSTCMANLLVFKNSSDSAPPECNRDTKASPGAPLCRGGDGSPHYFLICGRRKRMNRQPFCQDQDGLCAVGFTT